MSYNIITYELYILLYRLSGVSLRSSEGWRGSGSPVQVLRVQLLPGVPSAVASASAAGSVSVAASASAPVLLAGVGIMPGGVHFCKSSEGLRVASCRCRCLWSHDLRLLVSVLIECRLNCLRWCGLCWLPLVLSVSARTGLGVSGLLPGFRGVSVGGCQPVRDLDRVLLVLSWQL